MRNASSIVESSRAVRPLPTLQENTTDVAAIQPRLLSEHVNSTQAAEAVATGERDDCGRRNCIWTRLVSSVSTARACARLGARRALAAILDLFRVLKLVTGAAFGTNFVCLLFCVLRREHLGSFRTLTWEIGRGSATHPLYWVRY